MIKNVLKTTRMRTEGATRNVYVYIYNNKCKTCTKTRFGIKNVQSKTLIFEPEHESFVGLY